MAAMLGKLQSFWRRYAPAKPADPVPSNGVIDNVDSSEAASAESLPAVDKSPSQEAAPPIPESPPVNPEASPRAVKRPATRAQRLMADLSVLRGDMRTLESKLDGLKSRCDRFDQAIASTPSKEPAEYGPILEEIEALRRRVDDNHEQARDITDSLQSLADTHESLRSASSSIIERVQRQNDRITHADERIEDLVRRIEHLQFTFQDTVTSITTAHRELAEREAMRARDQSGRIVGLYVIAAVALTVALATLVIVLSRVGI